MTDGRDESVPALFEMFLREPSAERFLRLREAVAAAPFYAPYGGARPGDVWQLLEANRFAEARDYLRALMPNWLLSPSAHELLSFAHWKLGDQDVAAYERFASMRLLDAILATGDGSEEHPYLVLQTADEYYVLERLGKESQRQSLVRKIGGSYDTQTCSEGDVVWFDVSALLATLDKRTQR